MDEAPRVFADFNNLGVGGLVRLDCRGTVEDMAALGIGFVDGLALRVSDGDLWATVRVRWSSEGCWAGEILDGIHEEGEPRNG
jgi:hypothetical protein